VHRLRSEFSIYSTDDGRFSMAGINESNVDYLATSVLKVL
jgi:aspartate/tyrosine/aromatic aminotransferase